VKNALNKPFPRLAGPMSDLVELSRPSRSPGPSRSPEAAYLAIDDNHLYEFDDGRVEALPMPTNTHQAIVCYLHLALAAFVRAGGLGSVRVSPLPVRLWKEKYREPDVFFMAAEHASRIMDRSWDGCDLAMEVVSEGARNRKRDLIDKRSDYAKAGIPEYWIVDPKEKRIVVLTLKGKKYAVHGVFRPGKRAASRLLAGFSVDVTEVLSAK
jgi:Uma2 family endonuclease